MCAFKTRYQAALVTGATSGIGEAIARSLPPETDLLLTGRNGEKLAALERGLAAPGRRVTVIVADLGNPADLDRLVAAADGFGIDLLVNNAGLGQFGRFVENAIAVEREMVLVNVVATTMLTRRLLPGLLARVRQAGGRGGVIIVGSVVGFAPIAFMTTYAATKAFDVTFAQGLAAELVAEPIDVVALCPGSTATQFAARASLHSLGAPGHSPDRVARAALAALGRRTTVVVGPGNTLLTGLFKLLPGGLVARIAGMVMGRFVA